MVFVRRASFNVVNRLRVQVQLVTARGWVNQQHAIRRIQRLVSNALAFQRPHTIGQTINHGIQQLVAVLTGAGRQVAFNRTEQVSTRVVGYVDIDVFNHE